MSETVIIGRARPEMKRSQDRVAAPRPVFLPDRVGQLVTVDGVALGWVRKHPAHPSQWEGFTLGGLIVAGRVETKRAAVAALLAHTISPVAARAWADAAPAKSRATSAERRARRAADASEVPDDLRADTLSQRLQPVQEVSA